MGGSPVDELVSELQTKSSIGCVQKLIHTTTGAISSLGYSTLPLRPADVSSLLFGGGIG